MSRFNDNPMMDPIFFTPPRGSDKRMPLYKGGGGGSSGVYYGNMDNLYGVQSQAAQYMLDNSMPYIPEYMTNSNVMVKESMDGTLTERARRTAAADSGAALGSALSASQRGLERYGTTLNPNAVNANMTNAALAGAAMKAGSMNQAQDWAESQKWNRNAGALGQATGMGMGSMESLGGTARGYGAAGSSLITNESANAAGYGRFGAAVASNAFKDGGSVKTKPGLHLAAGGGANPWAAWKNNNPIQTSEQQSNSGGGLGDAVGAVAMGASPILIGKGMKAGLSAVKGAMAPAAPAAVAPTASTGSGLTTGTASIETGGAMANGTEGVVAAKSAADTTAATTAASNTAAAAGADVAGTAAATGALEGTAATGATAATDAALATGATVGAEAAGTAAATVGAEAAGAAAAGELATAAGTSATMGPVGWVAAGALALGALGASQGWFGATGGRVDRNDPTHMRRKDMKTGGDVQGKGTSTSDDIPAWLSDGEHVQNAVSSELAGLDTLDKINNEGLKVRSGKQSPEAAKANIGRAMIERGAELTGGLELAKGGKVGCKMASGGNVGIALGAAADEWNKQRVIGMEQSLTDLRLKLARPQIETQDDQIQASKSLYKYQDASNKAGLDTLPQQTSNTKKQQQITGIGLDNTLTGYAGQKLNYGNKDSAIKILNQAVAAQPGFDGTTVVDVTPQKNGAGVFLHMSDKSVKPVSRDEIVGAMGSIKQGEYQFIHDNAGNVYTGDKKTGAVTQQVKGDPVLAKQHTPASIQENQYNAGTLGIPESDALLRKERQAFISNAAKAAMPGQEQAAMESAAAWYDKQYGYGKGAGKPTPAGKSGYNWKDWAAPQQ
jgi:hypothetical protein